MIGFIGTQFLSGEILVYLWIAISVIGSSLAAILGIRSSKRVNIPTASPTTKRIALTWVLLMFYCLAAIAVAWPLNGKQLTMFVNLFVLIGWMATGQQLSFSPIWPGLIVIVLLLVGYFLFPGIYYLWMAILGGGGLIALGVYIRTRW